LKTLTDFDHFALLLASNEFHTMLIANINILAIQGHPKLSISRFRGNWTLVVHAWDIPLQCPYSRSELSRTASELWRRNIQPFHFCALFWLP